MANLNERIEDVVSGDNFEVVRSIDNIAVGQSIIEAWFTVKEDHWEDEYIFQKHISIIDSPDEGVIWDTGNTDTIANLFFKLQPEDTELLSPYFEYVYDIQVKTDADNLYTPEQGVFVTRPSITAES